MNSRRLPRDCTRATDAVPTERSTSNFHFYARVSQKYVVPFFFYLHLNLQNKNLIIIICEIVMTSACLQTLNFHKIQLRDITHSTGFYLTTCFTYAAHKRLNSRTFAASAISLGMLLYHCIPFPNSEFFANTVEKFDVLGS